MKIVNLMEFRRLPVGTLFMKYTPGAFEDLQAKGETLEVDFTYENITSWVKSASSNEMFDRLLAAERDGESLLMDFDATGRDGCYENDQLFAVYEKRDVKMLIDKLYRCLVSAYY